MATSGSNTTWSSNGGHYIKVTWNETSQSTTENRSAVTVNLYIGSKSGWSISDSSNSYSLTVNGTTVSGSNTSVNHTGGETLIRSYSTMIYHNSDGTKSFSMKGSVSGYYFGSITGSTFSGTLNTIPRASTLAYASTSNLIAGEDKSISISRANSSFYHTVRIYLTKSGVSDYLLRTESFNASTTSKTIEWTNSEIAAFWSNGHGYWTGTNMIVTTYYAGDAIGTSQQSGTLDYRSNNSFGSLGGNFNIGQSVSVSIAKASSLYSHEAQLRTSDGTVVASQGITSGTSFTMTPTASTLYSKAPSSNSLPVYLWIRTVLTASTSTQVFTWTNEDSVTAYVTDSNPTVGTLTYADINSAVTAITTSNQVIVPTKSIPRIIFTPATAINGAIIVDYTISVGNETKSKTSSGYLDFSPITAQANTNATMTVRDSRGNTSSSTVLMTVVPYSSPMLDVTAKRNDGFSDAVTLTAKATVSSVNAKNSVNASTGFKYRVRQLPQTGENGWGTFTGRASSGTNPTYTMTTLSTSHPNTNSFEYEVEVTDAFGGVSKVRKTIGTGSPVVFMDPGKASVGVGRFPQNTNTLEVQEKMYVYPSLGTSAKAGSIFTANTNKAYIHFPAAPSNNDPGFIMSETSSTAADLNKGVIHICPSDDSDNTNDYVTIRATNFALPENVRIYTGGNAYFAGEVTVGSLKTGTISVNGSMLNLNNSSSEMLRLTANSGTHGYITIYDGTTRVGYFGSVTNATRDLRVTADSGALLLRGSSNVKLEIGSTAILTVTSGASTFATDLNVTGNVNPTKGVSFAGGYESVDGNVYYNGSRLRVRVGGSFRDIAHSGDTFDNGSGTIEGSLIHNSGYMHLKVFNTTSSHYSSTSTSTSRAEMYYSGASNNRVIFIARTNSGSTVATTLQAGTILESSSIRYKEAIEEYREDALQKIMETGIKTYRFKGHAIGARKVGVIIEHGVPDEIVSLDRDAIDSYSMTAMSWKAIQQLGHELFVKDEEIQHLNEEQERMKKEKTAMKTRMTKLEKKNKELEERLARIEALLEGGN